MSDLALSASAEPGIDDVSDITLNGGTVVTRSTAQAASGAAAFLFNDTFGASQNGRGKDQLNTYRYSVSTCAFRLKTDPNSGKYGAIIQWLSLGTPTVGGVGVDEATRKLQLFDINGGVDVVASGGVALSLDTWYRLYIKSDYNGGTTWDVDVLLYDETGNTLHETVSANGMLEAGAPSGLWIGSANHTNWRGQAIEVYVDDPCLFINNSAMPTPAVRPMHKMTSPDADGSLNDWPIDQDADGVHWDEVSEAVVHDGNSSYIGTTAVAKQDRFTHPALGLDGTPTIYGVELAAYAGSTLGSTVYLRQQFYLSTHTPTQANSGFWLPGAPYEYHRFFRATDNEGTDWTEAVVDSYEKGIICDIVGGGNEARCTVLRSVTCYDGGLGAAGNIKKISGVPWANVKQVSGVAEASLKKVSGVAAN